jgi:tetratricopeptide (TPR) repeat protein
MSTSSRARLVAVLLLLPLRITALDEAAKISAPDPELAAADQLFRAGKFADAESGYQAILQRNTSLVPAQVGLARSMLRQQKIDESFDAVNRALTSTPDSADLLAVRGDVQFRRGEMAAAEVSYLRAHVVDRKGVRPALTPTILH